MNGLSAKGEAMSYECKGGLIELVLHRAPCNEIGSKSLDELEVFSRALQAAAEPVHALIIYSDLKCGFCAGADLRELYDRSKEMEKHDAVTGIRDFLERIHCVMNA